MEDPRPELKNGEAFLRAIVLFVLGGLALVGGLAAYFLVLFTHCFTFDFSRPVFPAFKRKLWTANIFVPFLVLVGVALCVSAIVEPILRGAGLSSLVSFLAPLAGTFFLLQFVLIWFSIWVPLERKLICRRLAACGVSPQQIQSGICVGISDPAKSSFKRMSMAEDDLGMLWFNPGMLSYRGDADQFDVTPHQLVEVERKVDAAAMSAYGGTVNVILRFEQQNGVQRRVRLHTEGCWTLTGMAKAMDRLADQIVRWQENAAAPAASETTRA